MTPTKAARAAPALAEHDPHVELKSEDRLSETLTPASPSAPGGDDAPGGEIVLVSESLPATNRDSILAASAKAIALVEGARDPETVLKGERYLESIEHAMRHAGLFRTDEIRIVNEGKLRARWKLGHLLAKVERAKHPGKGKLASAGLTSLLAQVALDKQTALEAQRIGALPAAELDQALERYRKLDTLGTFADLIRVARPFWYRENRQQKHKAMKGQERSPDRHYPTLTDREIMDFRIGAASVRDIANRDCALFLWCTSSNVDRALEVVRAWDFEFKSSAVWIKDKFGLGDVFRNQHELLLYGTRGDMPGPQYQPPSVFVAPEASTAPSRQSCAKQGSSPRGPLRDTRSLRPRPSGLERTRRCSQG
jgi:N6-adenosine-specific RNA methylase IME4